MIYLSTSMTLMDILMACVGLVIGAAIVSAIAVLIMIIAWRHFGFDADIEQEWEVQDE